MRNIKLTLEYDGAAFFGFQRQPGHLSVQEALENALSKFFDRKMKIASASGRTDTGVHAEGQVVNFKTDSAIPVAKIQRGLNAWLPEKLAVVAIDEVPANFHARFSAKSKTYEYLIYNARARSPLKASRVWHVDYPLDFQKMRKAARLLKGRHDFKAFCASGSSVESTVRKLKRCELKKEGNLLRLLMEADGFLYHMVRNIAGTLVECGAGKLGLEELKKILHSKDRRRAGRTAPAHALSLISVTY